MGFFSEVVTGLVNGYHSVAGSRVQRCCREAGLEPNEIDGNRITLYFKDPQAQDGIRKISFYEGDTLTGVCCVSDAALADNQVPEKVLGHLLTRNRQRAVGAW